MENSVDALNIVKEALKVFRADIQGIGETAVLQNHNCLETCDYIITKTQVKVNELENEIADLNKKIDELENAIGFMENEKQQLNRVLQQQEQSLLSLNMELSQVSSELSSLQVQLICATDDEERQEVESLINITQNRRNALSDTAQNTEQNIRDNKDKELHLSMEIKEHFVQKDECCNRLSVTKNRFAQYKEKLDRLVILNRNVRMDFQVYVQAIKKFENCSSDSVDHKYQVINECILLIEEMEAIL